MLLPEEVFLSHSSADRLFASKLAEVLRRHGIPVWDSDTNILGLQQWHDETGAAPLRRDWLAYYACHDIGRGDSAPEGGDRRHPDHPN